MKGVLFLLICAIYFKACSFCDVKTSHGVVNGIQQLSKNGKFYWSFNGIPYAEPPIGKLRFKAPIPKIPWVQTLKAHEIRSGCIEFRDGVRGQEDCLYLNIHTPQLGSDDPLPVMVYIHGDSSTQGNTSKILAGPGYMLDKGTVMASINYRLGVFGFLCTGDSVAPGNFGLKDQLQALYWIKNNIRQFGGNPDDITLFGEGSGAEYVHLHTLSERSAKLFKRVILQSGTALNPNAFTSDPNYYQLPKKVAAKFNCPTANSLLMIECLRKVDAHKLVTTRYVSDGILRNLGIWLPAKELVRTHAFMTDTPQKLIGKMKFKDCPMISGYVKDEGTFFSRRLVENQKLYDECVKDPKNAVKLLLSRYGPSRGKNVTKLAEKIVNYYFGSKMSGDKDFNIRQFTKIATILLYEYPQKQLLEFMKPRKKTSLFSYQFTYRGNLSYALPFGGEFAKRGIAQGDDLFYLYPLSSKSIGPKFNIERTKDDREVATLMTELWTGFAKNSKPSSSLLENAHAWQPYKNGGYLKIGNGTDTKAKWTKVDLEDSLKFWFENVPQYCLTSSCKHSKEDSDSKDDSDSKEDKNKKDSKEDKTKEDSMEDKTKEDSKEDTPKKDSKEDKTKEDSKEDKTKKDSKEDKTKKDSKEDKTKEDSKEDKTKKDSKEDKTKKDSKEDTTKKDSKEDNHSKEDKRSG